MKVLVLHNSYKFFGGEDTVYFQEVDAYKKLGYEVKTFHKSNNEIGFFDICFCLWNPRSFLAVRRLVKSFRPDIIHVHNFIFKLSPSVFWAFNKSATVYLTIHNYRFLCPSGTLFIDGKTDLSSKTKAGLLRNIIKGVYQKSIVKTAMLSLIFKLNQGIGTFKKINKFIFLTNFSRDIHLQWNKKLFKKHLIKPNFSSVAPLKSSNPEIDIIFIGRISIEKGLDLVLPTLVLHQNLSIIIIGEGPDFERLKIKYQQYEHIDFYGKQEHKNVICLLQNSKFLLFPSIWYEGMPMIIIEALALRKPIIAYNFGAVKSMIKNNYNGMLFNSNQELNEILNNLKNVDYHTLSNNAYLEYKAKYSLKQGLDNLKNL